VGNSSLSSKKRERNGNDGAEGTDYAWGCMKVKEKAVMGLPPYHRAGTSIS